MSQARGIRDKLWKKKVELVDKYGHRVTTRDRKTMNSILNNIRYLTDHEREDALIWFEFLEEDLKKGDV